jgi:hypothetical protein
MHLGGHRRRRPLRTCRKAPEMQSFSLFLPNLKNTILPAVCKDGQSA